MVYFLDFQLCLCMVGFMRAFLFMWLNIVCTMSEMLFEIKVAYHMARCNILNPGKIRIMNSRWIRGSIRVDATSSVIMAKPTKTTCLQPNRTIFKICVLVIFIISRYLVSEKYAKLCASSIHFVQN